MLRIWMTVIAFCMAILSVSTCVICNNTARASLVFENEEQDISKSSDKDDVALFLVFIEAGRGTPNNYFTPKSYSLERRQSALWKIREKNERWFVQRNGKLEILVGKNRT